MSGPCCLPEPKLCLAAAEALYTHFSSMKTYSAAKLYEEQSRWFCMLAVRLLLAAVCIEKYLWTHERQRELCAIVDLRENQWQ